jgi:hypothetical protein
VSESNVKSLVGTAIKLGLLDSQTGKNHSAAWIGAVSWTSRGNWFPDDWKLELIYLSGSLHRVVGYGYIQFRCLKT